MQHRWDMKPNIISQTGYEKKLKSDRGYEIFGEILTFPSSPLPSIINDRSLNRTFRSSLTKYSSTKNVLPTMYQSIPSLTPGAWPSLPPPPRRPPRIRTFSLPGGRVFAQLSLPGASGFWIRDVFYSFERKMQELLDLLQRNRWQLAKQVLLRCFISIFAKTVDVCCIFTEICIFVKIDYFRQFRFDKISSHPRVIFADAGSSSSLKFCMSYITRTIANIRSVSMLFP